MNIAKGFSRNPDIEKARMEFERAQKVEQRFHKDFDGLDFTMSVACRIGSVLLLARAFAPSMVTFGRISFCFHCDVRGAIAYRNNSRGFPERLSIDSVGSATGSFGLARIGKACASST